MTLIQMVEMESISVNTRLAKAKQALDVENYGDARDQYEILAGIGSKEALLALGYIYERGGKGVERDYSAARYWFERSLNEGKAVRAALALGKFYYLGLGVPVDFVRSYSYLAKVEQSNDAVALLRLGVMFELGKGVPKNIDRARSLYRRSARLKNIFARKNLGVLEVKRGNVLIGLLLWSSAFLQGVTLGLIKRYDSRLQNW